MPGEGQFITPISGGADPATPIPVGPGQLPGIATGQRTVPTPGTAVQCPNIPVPEGFDLVVKAKDGNTDLVYISDSKAGAENHATAFPLKASNALELGIPNANILWVDAIVANEGLDFIVEASS